ncbi:MAG TPA: AMP-binding protein [Ktedonobacteraceae bacterium]|nr:AMP-binding protein [Ktedonobacteraceae bacterium]
MADSADSQAGTRALFRPSLQYPTIPYAEILAATARRFPEQEAVLFHETTLTYRELDALVNTLANALLDLGIKQGQRICLFLANCPEYLISWFAITRIGAVASPLNPSYKEREVAYQLGNSEAVALIVQENLLPLVQAVREQAPKLEYLLIVGAEQHRPQEHLYAFSSLLSSYSSKPPAPLVYSPDDLLTLPYSSGTTGLPKGVMLSQKNLVTNVYQSVATARITSRDRMLSFIPLYHIYGIMLMGCAALSGACLLLMERFDPARWLQLIHEQRATIVYSVPQILAVIADWPGLERYDLSSVRFNQCGAAPVPPALARRFEAQTHIPVMTSYGLTEASPGTHSNPVYNPHLIKVETIGLPIHDTRQKIVDIESGETELAAGEEGELIVQGPQIMLGYWKAPEATAEVLRNGWLYTGDIGWRDAEGYVTITDRKKEMIKYKGFSVAPAQIEALLLEHPAVSDVAVIARPDREAGEVPKAFVVLRRGYENQVASELMAWTNEKLATYKHVREIEYIESIPRNPSGKILRRILKEQEREKMGPA